MPLSTVAKEASMTRKTDYLFQRPGSAHWYVKLQSPGGRIEKSLGTSDRAQAEILASPFIQAHKVRLLEPSPRGQVTWRHGVPPGQGHIPSGGARLTADDGQRKFLHQN